MLCNSSRLYTVVTVVDAVNFPNLLSSLKCFEDVSKDGVDEGKHNEIKNSIYTLMIENIEVSNVILLKKVELVSRNKIELRKKLVETLNPKARVIT